MFCRPLACLFRVCGTAPTNTSTDKYFALLALSSAPLISLTAIIITYERVDSFHDELIFTKDILLILLHVGHIANSFFQRKDYCTMMSRLDAVNQELELRKRQSPQRVIFLSFVVTQVLLAVHYVMLYRNVGYINILGKELRAVVTYAPLIQRLSLVVVLRSQFSSLNSLLQHVPASSQSLRRLDFVVRIHSELQLLVGKINSYYCLHNFLYTGVMVLSLLMQMYDAFMDISNWDCGLLMVVIVEEIHLAWFICVCVVCGACAQEATRASRLAHRALLPGSSRRLCQQVRLFSALPPPLTFTVGGVFVLDRALITKLAVLAVSYLNIVLQLQDVRLLDSGSAGSTTIHTI